MVLVVPPLASANNDQALNHVQKHPIGVFV